MSLVICVRVGGFQMEQERVTERLREQDLLLDAAKRNIQYELQGVLADRLLLKKEL